MYENIFKVGDSWRWYRQTPIGPLIPRDPISYRIIYIENSTVYYLIVDESKGPREVIADNINRWIEMFEHNANSNSIFAANERWLRCDSLLVQNSEIESKVESRFNRI